MTLQIKVPELPESVADALLLDWKKQPGEEVARDEILIEIETDKVALEVPAPEDGKLTEILQPAGATVSAGDVLALFEAGELSVAPEPAVAEAEPEAASQADSAAGRLSPAVRRLVEQHGIDTAAIKGSGKKGLILKQDILEHIGDPVSQGVGNETELEAKTAVVEAVQAVSPTTTGESAERTETRVAMSRIRKTIANRLLHAQQSAALLTTFNEVDMQPVMTLRKQYKELFEQKHGAKLGFMSFFVKAGVAALQRFPLVNAYIDGTDIIQHNYNDIGIAVSSPRGLVVPVLRSCETLSFAQIESQILQYGTQARDGTINFNDLTGGTFTITNGGVFGSLLSTPIINPPQSAILGMHKIQPRPMAVDGEVVVRPMMYLALTYDHRIIDGSEAVQFLVTIKQSLEDPARLLLDI